MFDWSTAAILVLACVYVHLDAMQKKRVRMPRTNRIQRHEHSSRYADSVNELAYVYSF